MNLKTPWAWSLRPTMWEHPDGLFVIQATIVNAQTGQVLHFTHRATAHSAEESATTRHALKDQLRQDLLPYAEEGQ